MSTMMMSSLYSMTVMFFPTSSTPPRGIMRRLSPAGGMMSGFFLESRSNAGAGKRLPRDGGLRLLELLMLLGAPLCGGRVLRIGFGPRVCAGLGVVSGLFGFLFFFYI